MQRHAGAPSSLLRDRLPWVGLGALLISFGGLSALWGFLAQVAPSFGVGEAAQSAVLTAGLVVSGGAGLAAAGLGDRFGRTWPLVVGMLLAIAGAVALLMGHGLTAYTAGVLLAGGFWNFPMAYQMGLIASADGHGRVAVLMPAALAIGGALGPMLAGSLLTEGGGYAPLYGLFIAATAASLAAFAWLSRRIAAKGTAR